MNGENQALDLCNARVKASDDDRTTALISEELVLRNTIRFIDKDAEAPDSRREDGGDKDGPLSQKNNGTVLSVPLHVPEESRAPDQENPFSVGGVNDDEDMDIGVDLSLDESGVLESDPLTAPAVSSILGSLASVTDKDSDKASEAEPSRSSDAEAPPPAQQEGAGPRPGAKKVTFPSDEDIVSGSVEPKDPWRHGEYRLLFYTSQVLQVSRASLCL